MRMLRLKAKPVLYNRLYTVAVIVVLRPTGLVLPPVVVLIVRWRGMLRRGEARWDSLGGNNGARVGDKLIIARQ
jgi:hypothetical protein